MRIYAFALMLVAALCGTSAPAWAGLCDAPTRWPGDAAKDVAFTGVSAFQTGMRGDGPNLPAPVLVNGDVLGLGKDLPLSAGGVTIQGPVICVRYRPEWLGLDVANAGLTDATAILSIGPVGGVQLEAELPRLTPGEVRRVLVMSGALIAATPADTLRLKIKP